MLEAPQHYFDVEKKEQKQNPETKISYEQLYQKLSKEQGDIPQDFFVKFLKEKEAKL